MVPIALCALIATIIVVERFIFFSLLRRSRKVFLPQLRTLLDTGDYDAAIALCNASDLPLARLVRRGIELRNMKESEQKEGVMNASNWEVPRLERYVGALGTIANISTLLGLLGTVSGNIRAFGVLAASGAMGNPALLAGAIAEALITTAAGLIVSIPAMIFHNYFVSQSNSSIIELESSVGDILLLLNSTKKGAGRAV